MSEALAAAARTTQNRSPAWSATSGRAQSTFTRPVRGGAVWYWQEPDAPGAPAGSGRIVMMRVSPRRVMLELQRAAGVPLDAKYGPATRAGLLRLTERFRAPGADTGAINDANLILQALLVAYHGARGEIYVPNSTEFPTAAANPVPEITGDATFTDAIDLSPQGAPLRPDVPSPGAPSPSAPAPRPAYDPTPTVADPAPRGDVVDLVPRSETAIVPAPAPTPNATLQLTAPGAPVAGALGWVQAHPYATAGLAAGAIVLGIVIVRAAEKAR